VQLLGREGMHPPFLEWRLAAEETELGVKCSILHSIF